MNLYVRNFSSAFTGNVEIYLEDPSTSTPWPISPTYAGVATTANTVLPWPRSPQGDVIPFWCGTNDGTGPQNITAHTPSGSSSIQVRLLDDGTGGLAFTFVG
jgi:hypothetical protein